MTARCAAAARARPPRHRLPPLEVEVVAPLEQPPALAPVDGKLADRRDRLEEEGRAREEQRDGERVTVLRFRERQFPGERGPVPVGVAGSRDNSIQGDAGSSRPQAARRGEDRPWARPRSGGELFEPLVFPPALAVELSLEGVPVVLDRGAAGNVADAVPQVIFYASGEATPGSLSFRRGATGEFLWQLRWDLLGRIEVTDDPLEAGDA